MPLSTINSNSIGNGTVIAADILDGTISSSKLVSANIAGDRIAANTLSNTVFQTGSVESYLRSQTLDFGMRNRIINGAMRIDQRNAGAGVSNDTSGTQYSLDRWNIYGTQSAKFTVQQDSSANTVAGFTSSLKVTSSSAYALNGTDTFWAQQLIEGNNVADLRFGTANARPITISFWVRSSLTGTFGGVLKNSATDRNYPFSYTISAANTWEQKFITATGDTSGTWLTTNGIGLMVRFSLGTNYTGTAGAWAGGYIDSGTGQTNLVGTNGATWYVTGVQLEEGSVPTPFEYRHHTNELQLCQRYYWKNGGAPQYARIGIGPANSTTDALVTVFMQTPMRISPSAVTTTGSFGVWAGATVFSVSAITIDTTSTSPYTTTISAVSSGLTVGTTYQLLGNNDATASLALSAEL